MTLQCPECGDGDMEVTTLVSCEGVAFSDSSATVRLTNDHEVYIGCAECGFERTIRTDFGHRIVILPSLEMVR